MQQLAGSGLGYSALEAAHRCDACELSVVVPCFNEEEVVEAFHGRMAAACKAARVDDYEIVFVDDGSTDTTWARITALAERSPHVVGVRLFRNFGHQIAVTAGLRAAHGDRVMLIDADLQDPPELLTAMMAEMERGADVVYGRRELREGESLFKKLSAKAFYQLLGALTDTRIPRDTGDFRLMSRKVVDALNAMPEQQRFIRGMVSWIGGRQVEVRYVRHSRLAGKTKYPLRKMIRFALDAITSFSISPLRFAIWLSLAGWLFSLVILAYGLNAWLSGHVVPGWASTIFVISIFGNLQLLVLGTMGEYIGRLFIEQKRRPLFLVGEVVGRSEDARPATTEPASPRRAIVPGVRAEASAALVEAS